MVDEGASFEEAWGTVFAKPGAAEKGSTNVEITVRSPGGHSSIPRDHTSIGILSELIYLIESTQYPTRLYDENPYFTQLQCGAAYSPDFDPKLKKLLDQRLLESRSEGGEHVCAKKSDTLALEAAKQGPEIRYLLQTSQAVDIISGGVKVNALPERAQAIVNHRVNGSYLISLLRYFCFQILSAFCDRSTFIILSLPCHPSFPYLIQSQKPSTDNPVPVGETAQAVFDHLTRVASHIATKHNLTLHAFDGIEAPSSLILSHNDVLAPAPVTPSDTNKLTPYSILAGTNRAIYGSHIITTPGIMTGNTDTRFFWDLTRHIFRFAPGYDGEDEEGLGNIHTVNERVSVRNHVNAVKWFTLFVRNLDEAEL